PSDTIEGYKYIKVRLFAIGHYKSISSRNLYSPYKLFPFPLDNFYYLSFFSTIFGLTIYHNPHNIAVKRIVQIFCFYANVLFYFWRYYKRKPWIYKVYCTCNIIGLTLLRPKVAIRSEERRVGKEATSPA